jgi:hypothetical protein
MATGAARFVRTQRISERIGTPRNPARTTTAKEV